MQDPAQAAANAVAAHAASLATRLALIVCEAGLLRPERAASLSEEIQSIGLELLKIGADDAATDYWDAAEYLTNYARSQ